MFRIIQWAISLLLLSGSVYGLPENKSEPTLYVFSREDLRTVQQEPATLNRLIARAQRALENPQYSVTDKKILPASGSPHDYYSQATYWWPNPNTKNGLPYVRRDGVRNPEIDELKDKDRLQAMTKDVTSLALAFHFTGETKYASKARSLLKTWFLDPGTRMHPHLQYAQAIPGITEGRGIGIIDSRFLIPLVDAVTLLDNQLSTKEVREIRAWYRAFNHWLLTSDNGFEEDNWHNNHGTWYDAQVVAYALFSNDVETAKRRLRITQIRRIASQFDRHGNQHAELERTRPWGYTNFNLEAYSVLGRLGETVGMDIWNYSLDHHSLRRGFTLVAEMVLKPSDWPYKDLYGMDLSRAYRSLYAARKAYEDPLFETALKRIEQQASGDRSLPDPRLWPI